MELKNVMSRVWLNGHEISSYAGFYSLKDLSAALSSEGVRLNINTMQRQTNFLNLVNVMFGLSLTRNDKVASVFKENRIYIRRYGDMYCDFRLFVIFYALSCADAMLDCLKKGICCM